MPILCSACFVYLINFKPFYMKNGIQIESRQTTTTFPSSKMTGKNNAANASLFEIFGDKHLCTEVRGASYGHKEGRQNLNQMETCRNDPRDLGIGERARKGRKAE